MFRSNAFLLYAIVVAAIGCNGFAPAFSPATSIKAAMPPTKALMKSKVVLRMSEEPKTDEAAPPAKVEGTFYDDEVDPTQYAAPKQGISDNMRARLMAEANTGLDSNSKQTNVLLYICIGVVVLVALGGQGILY